MSTDDNKKKLTDEALRILLDANNTQSYIAREYGVTKQYVSQRVKRLERGAAVRAVPVAARAVESLWDTKAAADANYARLIAIMDQSELLTGDRIRVIAEIRQHLAFSMQVMETLFAVQESKAFMDEVMDVLEECDPKVRQRVFDRLRQKKSLRAAFIQG